MNICKEDFKPFISELKEELSYKLDEYIENKINKYKEYENNMLIFMNLPFILELKKENQILKNRIIQLETLLEDNIKLEIIESNFNNNYNFVENENYTTNKNIKLVNLNKFDNNFKNNIDLEKNDNYDSDPESLSSYDMNENSTINTNTNNTIWKYDKEPIVENEREEDILSQKETVVLSEREQEEDLESEQEEDVESEQEEVVESEQEEDVETEKEEVIESEQEEDVEEEEELYEFTYRKKIYYCTDEKFVSGYLYNILSDGEPGEEVGYISNKKVVLNKK